MRRPARAVVGWTGGELWVGFGFTGAAPYGGKCGSVSAYRGLRIFDPKMRSSKDDFH